MSIDHTVKQALLAELERRVLSPAARSVPSAWSVLIVDQVTIKVVSSLIKATDLLRYNIVLVEEIAPLRDPMQGMHALYFVQPTLRNVNFIARDFVVEQSATEAVVDEVEYEAAPEPTSGCCGGGRAATTRTTRRAVPIQLYASCQVFWASPPSAAVQKAIAAPDLAKHVRSADAVTAPGVAVDPRGLITLGSPTLGEMLEGRVSLEGRAQLVGQELAAFVRALAVATGGAAPVAVRAASNSPIAKQIAHATSAALDAQEAGTEQAAATGSGAGPLVVVLDRGVDLVTPLLHSFRVEPLARDLLPDVSETAYTPSEGGSAMPLDPLENPLWGRWRAALFSDAPAGIAADFKQFQNGNQAVAQQELLAPSGSPAPGGDAQRPDMATLRAVLAALPTFTQDKAAYSGLIDLMTRVKDAYTKRNLRDLTLIEQDVAVGDDHAERYEGVGGPVGISGSAAFVRVREMLAQGTLSEADGARLALIAMLSLSPGVPPELRNELFATGPGGQAASRIWRGLIALARTTTSSYSNVWTSLQRAPSGALAAPFSSAAGVAVLGGLAPAGAAAGVVGAHAINGDGSPSGGLLSRHRGPPKVARRDFDRTAMMWSRWRPTMALIAADIAAPHADAARALEADVPFARQPTGWHATGSSRMQGSSIPSAGVSARRRWRSEPSSGPPTASGPLSPAAPRVGRPPLVFYIAGGPTHEEYLAAAAISADSSFPYEVYVAGPPPVTPSEFVAQLMRAA